VRMPSSVTRDLARLAESMGYTLVRRTKHGLRYEREGHTVSIPTSPGTQGTVAATKAQLRRGLRR
jgi:hypothetical protein